MNTSLLTHKFERMGARLKIVDVPTNRRIRTGLVSLDVRSDRKGEYFEIAPGLLQEPEIEVLDVRPGDRHLLLLVRDEAVKNKYLCGHDERHWFVAGIPDAAPVGTVAQAKISLQPTEVQSAVAQRHVSGKARQRRKNAAFIRQGEWFFMPAPRVVIDPRQILFHEPITRGNGGKPHWVDECHRIGGDLVHVCNRHPQGLTVSEYARLLNRTPEADRWNWRTFRRNPLVYVRGRVRHPDHATIVLHDWHRVIMNTENQSAAMRNVAFLD